VKNLRKQLAVGLGCAIAGLASYPAFPQSKATNADAEALRSQMAQMQVQMQQLQKQLDDLQAKQTQTAAKQEEVAAKQEAASAPVTAADLPSYETKSEIKQPPSALPGVSEPLPEGYVRLGDTGNLLKIDLIAQLDAMTDDTKMTPDLFVTSSIPVKGSPFYNAGWRSNLSAKQSIFRLDFRRETPLGTLKVVYKNNFFGSSGDMGFNTQYFYSELENDRYKLLAGYFLSGFTDIDVFPNTLDFEGPNSFTFKYTPQIRFTPVIYKHGDSRLVLPMSLEKPNADIGVIDRFGTYSKTPDAVIALRWEAPDWHVQWANLFRDLGVEDSVTGEQITDSAWATQLTAAAGVFGDDSVQAWASYGKGYANFLQDISGYGLDAAFTTDGDLKAIKARGYGLGYTHSWNETMSTSGSYGFVAINPDENMLIDPTLPQQTQYFSLNFAWQFSERAMLGFEYLWGQNHDLLDNTGTAQRLQATLRYDLNP
jgi:hypothetical protein